METKSFRNTTYTVTDSRRGWKNDRTIHSLTGPKGAGYVLVEFDSGNTVLTDLATGRSRKGYAHDLGHVGETATGGVNTSEMIAPPAEPAEVPALRRSLVHWNKETERWGAKRMALEVGSSRARVTTANAAWMSACEVRDRVAQRLYDLTGEVE